MSDAAVTARQKMATNLQQLGMAFRVIGVLAAVVLMVASIPAGTPNAASSQFERDMGGWSLNGTVLTYWAVAVGMLLQAFWIGLVSDALAALLEDRP